MPIKYLLVSWRCCAIWSWLPVAGHGTSSGYRGRQNASSDTTVEVAKNMANKQQRAADKGRCSSLAPATFLPPPCYQVLRRAILWNTFGFIWLRIGTSGWLWWTVSLPSQNISSFRNFSEVTLLIPVRDLHADTSLLTLVVWTSLDSWCGVQINSIFLFVSCCWLYFSVPFG
jgi:hypothetical protein